MALLSTDQAKCFDRLHLTTLQTILDLIGAPPQLSYALSVYRRLRRFFFVAGASTRFVCFGGALCGIPQGCPFAPLLCNLAMWTWDAYVRAHRPDLRLLTLLDDRLVLGSSTEDLQAALDLTLQIDAALGPSLNLSKSV